MPATEANVAEFAGDLFIIKAAGARAEGGANLDEVTAAAEVANQNCRSMGIALSSCTIPASGRPIFDIAEDKMELGMGLHGEPGIRRGRMLTADEAAAEMATRILQDLPMDGHGDSQRAGCDTPIGTVHRLSGGPQAASFI